MMTVGWSGSITLSPTQTPKHERSLWCLIVLLNISHKPVLLNLSKITDPTCKNLLTQDPFCAWRTEDVDQIQKSGRKV